MNDSDTRRFNRRLAVLVLASFTVLVFAIVLRVGLGATPYDTTDGLGRPMGFNDTLHAGHLGIMVRNFDPAVLLSPTFTYEWILVLAHLGGAWLLLSRKLSSTRLTRWFFAIQTAVFPLGIVCLPFAPFLIGGTLAGGIDREGFVDIPYILAVSQPAWVAASIAIAMLLRGPGLGLAKLPHALRRAAAAGARTFSDAMQ